MSYSVRTLAAGIALAAGMTAVNVASAAPVTNALAIKNAVPGQVESVQWRWWGPGFVVGAIIGGALAAPYYYGRPYYYGPGPYYAAPYPAPYYGAPAYPVAPGPGYAAAAPAGGDAAYCAQRFKSYNPRTGTYMGTDGVRHPCP
jgi:hypothetical protein